MTVRLFRDAGAAGGAGGPAPFVGISSIVGDDGNGNIPPIPPTPPAPPPAPPAPPAGDNPPPNPPGPGNEPPKPPAEPVEGLNEDGSLMEGYIKNADGTITVDPNYEPDNGEGDEGDFWAEVDKITGRELKIEYPADVDPTTPAGVAHRIAAEREAAKEEFENYLQKTDPRGYAYLVHRAAGGSDEEFLGGPQGFSLPDKTTLAGSADAQAGLYKRDLLAAGLDEDSADALVEKAIKDNKLKDKAEAAWTKIDKAQKEELARLQAEEAEENKAYNQSLAVLDRTLNDQIKSGLGFVVPEAQQAEFKNYILQNLRYDNGKFFVVQEMGSDQKTMLESLFFQFKKGDLSTMVAKKAKTEAAQRLRLKLKSSSGGPGTGQNTGGNRSGYIPLGQIL